MPFQPLNGNVLLRHVEAAERTAGGLYVPDVAREAPAEGIVQAVPTGDVEVSIGDRVIYKRFSGEEITLEGEKLRLVPQGELLAKYVDADPIPG